MVVGQEDDRSGTVDINGDQFIEDDNIYLKVSPSQHNFRGYIELDLIPKSFGGEVTLVLGFPDMDINPKSFQVYTEFYQMREYTEITDYSTEYITFYNISEFEKLDIVDYNDYNVTVGNDKNTFLYRVKGHPEFPNRPEEEYVIAFYDYSPKPPNLSCTTFIFFQTDLIWRTEEVYEWGWKDVRPEFEMKQYSFRGMVKWYLADFNINQNQVYKARIYLDMPFSGLKKIEGEYFIGLKFASDTIKEAIENNRYYYLDPYFKSGWDKRIEVFANNTGVLETLYNFTVPVIVTDEVDWALVQDDLDDFYFEDSDNSTQINYEIDEYWVNSRAILWAKIPEIISGSTHKFYLYYNNSACASQEDAENAWDEYYKAVYHFNDGTGNELDSTSNNNDLTEVGTIGNTTLTYLGSARDFEGSDDYFEYADADFGLGSGNFNVEMLVNSDVDTDMRLLYTYNPSRGIFISVQTTLKTNFAVFADATKGTDSEDWSYTVDQTFYFVSTRTSAGAIAHYKDNILRGSNTGATGSIDGGGHGHIGVDYAHAKDLNGQMDEMRVSSIVRTDGYRNATRQAIFNGDYVYFGLVQSPVADQLINWVVNSSTPLVAEDTFFNLSAYVIVVGGSWDDVEDVYIRFSGEEETDYLHWNSSGFREVDVNNHFYLNTTKSQRVEYNDTCSQYIFNLELYINFTWGSIDCNTTSILLDISDTDIFYDVFIFNEVVGGEEGVSLLYLIAIVVIVSFVAILLFRRH